MTTLVELERAGSTSALARCTGDPDAFLERTWGRHAVVHTAAEPRGFADLLTFDDVDRLLSSTSLRTPAFRLVQAGTQIPESSYTRSATTGSKPVSGLVDPRRVFDRFADGATIVLQGLHRYHEPVALFTRQLEVELGHPCQVNAYITPPGAQGLALHDDPHDVLVLQAFGRKAWEIHAAPGEDREPLQAVVSSGDAIYMPTGTPHAASTQETLSGHLTVGIHVTPWREVVERAWRSFSDDPSLVGGIPAGWTRDADAFATELARRMRGIAARLGGIDAAAAAEREISRYLSTRPSLLRGALVDRFELESVDDDTIVRLREGGLLELRPNGERLEVLLGDRRLAMPSWLEPALRRLAASNGTRVGDLASEIADRESRLVLVRRLVREGALRLAPGERPSGRTLPM